MDPRVAAYCRYYDAQRGGQLPVFRGGRGQSGEGLGDILRGIFRVLAPIALRGVSTFAGHALDAHQKGATLSEAAKSALNAALKSVAGGIAERLQAQQSGSGGLMARNQARRITYAELPEYHALPYLQPVSRDNKGRYMPRRPAGGRRGGGSNVYKSPRGRRPARRLVRSTSPPPIASSRTFNF